MSMLEKFNKAIANSDANLANEIMHDNFEFFFWKH